ncbi:MAG: dihydroorotase [Alphaproteobacteria bacterium]
MIEFTLPKWYDLHTHFRQGDAVEAYIKAHLDMGCAGALAMPNTKPPTAVVTQDQENGEYWSVERYKRDLCDAGADQFDELIVPLYLTKDTTPDMILQGAKDGTLKACKSYPPHGTTGAEFGIPVTEYIENGVFNAMEEAGVVLCIHGEEHGLSPDKYFDRAGNAEEIFYTERMPRVREKFPNLKIVCEHVTTKKAVDFVLDSGDNVAASITPQHLIYTIGDLIQGLKYHLFCLPVLKHCEDRDALRLAAISSDNTKFFAGTDSAPHTVKATDCGCAAGCFTGGIAPQLYAQAFEMSGVDLSDKEGQEIFERFLCVNGPKFYGLPISEDRFTLIKEESAVQLLETVDGNVTPLPLGLGQSTIPWSIRL